MADVTYRIIIEGEGGSSEGPKKDSVARTVSGDSMSNPIGSFIKGVDKIKKMAPVAYALKYVDLGITTEINRTELKTGLSTYQERLNFNYSMAKQVLGIGGAIIGGALTGNVMAVVAGVGAAVNMAVQYSIAQENINLQRRVEDISIGMANVRAGAGGDRVGRSTY